MAATGTEDALPQGVGLAFWRWSLPSIAAAARSLPMLVRILRTFLSVVGRGYFRGWLGPMRQARQLRLV